MMMLSFRIYEIWIGTQNIKEKNKIIFLGGSVLVMYMYHGFIPK